VRTAQSRLRGTAVLVAAAAIAAVGCDDSATSGGSPPSTGGIVATATSRPPSSPPTTAADERAAVEAAYRKFWAVSWRLDTQPEAHWRQVLSAVAADPELTRILEGTRAQKNRGITRYGEVISRPTVVSISGASARVRDCQGADKSGQADVRTGRHLTVGVARNPLTGSLARGADGRWRVSDIRTGSGRC